MQRGFNSADHGIQFRRVRTVAKSTYLSSCPLVHRYQHGSRWTYFRKIGYWGLYVNLREENPNLVKIRQKILGTLREDLGKFYCCRRHSIAIKALSSSEME